MSPWLRAGITCVFAGVTNTFRVWIDSRCCGRVVVFRAGESAQSLSRRGSANLDEVIGVGTPSCDVVMLAWSHVWPPSLRHVMLRTFSLTMGQWFGTAKTNPTIGQLIRVLSLGSPVCVACRRRLATKLADGIHPSSFLRDDAIHDKVCADVACGRALFGLGSAADIQGLRVSP